MREAHQPYHHGNVKDSLLAMAMELIDANQDELISLRKLANAVGITPSAVYNHFANLDAATWHRHVAQFRFDTGGSELPGMATELRPGPG